MPTIRTVATADLRPAELIALRGLFAAAWPPPDASFTDDDWDHAMGGTHVLVEEDGAILAHGALVDRTLEHGDRTLRTGYVEAVATDPAHRTGGHASAVMATITTLLDRNGDGGAGYDLGALATLSPPFYERRGWERWTGPTSVRTRRTSRATPGADGLVLVRRTPTTPTTLDPGAGLTCDWRAGHVW